MGVAPNAADVITPKKPANYASASIKNLYAMVAQKIALRKEKMNEQ